MTALFKRASALGLIALLTSCAETPKQMEGPALPPPPVAKLTGLNAVIGRSAAALIAEFGKPEQDLREANGRRLQFSDATCVLDAYLYPPTPGREAVVTYVDARLPDGRDNDRAACVSALLKSRGR